VSKRCRGTGRNCRRGAKFVLISTNLARYLEKSLSRTSNTKSCSAMFYGTLWRGGGSARFMLGTKRNYSLVRHWGFCMNNMSRVWSQSKLSLSTKLNLYQYCITKYQFFYMAPRRGPYWSQTGRDYRPFTYVSKGVYWVSSGTIVSEIPRYPSSRALSPYLQSSQHEGHRCSVMLLDWQLILQPTVHWILILM